MYLVWHLLQKPVECSVEIKNLQKHIGKSTKDLPTEESAENLVFKNSTKERQNELISWTACNMTCKISYSGKDHCKSQPFSFHEEKVHSYILSGI